jgi:carbon monoxide dehydrogenase subunit G
MELTGEQLIPAPRETVWQALNDPEVLQASIPGCESLNRTADNAFEAKVKAKVGPVSASFTGAVTLSNIDPPKSYTISGEGKGGVAGFAKGGADVRLEEAEGGQTRLLYDVKAQVGGKLAQIGSRLIEGTAKKLAGEFFERFAQLVGNPAVAPEPAPGHAAADHTSSQAHADHEQGHHAGPPPGLSDAELNRDVGRGAKTGVWVAGLIVVVLILLAIFGLGGSDTPPAH